jgi:hypothetical protein
MKACIVSSRTITKYNRMDAGFYLAVVEGAVVDELITEAERKLVVAERRLVELCREKQTQTLRIAKMIREGEIMPL